MRKLLVVVLWLTTICGVPHGQKPRNQPKAQQLSEEEKNKLEGW